MSDSRLQDALVSVASALVEQSYGPDARVCFVRIELETGDGDRLQESLKVGQADELLDADRQPIRRTKRYERGKTLLYADIRAVLLTAGRPLKGSVLAKRVGRAFTGYFRTFLASLVHDGKLVNDDAGYWLGDMPVGPLATDTIPTAV